MSQSLLAFPCFFLEPLLLPTSPSPAVLVLTGTQLSAVLDAYRIHGTDSPPPVLWESSEVCDTRDASRSSGT